MSNKIKQFFCKHDWISLDRNFSYKFDTIDNRSKIILITQKFKCELCNKELIMKYRNTN